MRVYQDKGDAIRGDRITVQARKISAVTVTNRTGKHKGQLATLRDNALCIIDVPFKAVLEKKKA